jgi:hypothetical protein
LRSQPPTLVVMEATGGMETEGDHESHAPTSLCRSPTLDRQHG